MTVSVTGHIVSDSLYTILMTPKDWELAKALPKDPPGRLEAVGIALYGSAWRSRLAAGLNISRNTLHEWLGGSWTKARRDIDGDLVDLLDRERDAAAERGVEITAIRRQLIGGRRP